MAKKEEPKEAKKPAENESTKPKKSKLTLILIGLLVVILGVGGFFGWQYFRGLKAKAAAASEAGSAEGKSAEGEKHDKKGSKASKDPKTLEGATINFEPFLVNLADRDASRYLKATIRIMVVDKEMAEKIGSAEVLVSRVRDTILGILSSKVAAEIVTSEGKEQLKKEILEKLNSFLPEEPAQEVFFTDFVVQF